MRSRAKRGREPFIGFCAPGQRYEGRLAQTPRTMLQAFGGGVSYSEDADYAEGEPSEFMGA